MSDLTPPSDISSIEALPPFIEAETDLTLQEVPDSSKLDYQLGHLVRVLDRRAVVQVYADALARKLARGEVDPEHARAELDILAADLGRLSDIVTRRLHLVKLEALFEAGALIPGT